MLIGLLFLLPLSDRASTTRSGRELGRADWSTDGLVRLGLDAAFAASVRVHVVPGSSALFVFDASPDTESLRTALPPQAEEVARLIMDREQMTRLHAGFDD